MENIPSFSVLFSSHPWKQQAYAHLLLLSHADVIGIVLDYAAAIRFSFARSIGKKDSADGQLHDPTGMCLHTHELFVADPVASQIQVFHERTGQFLRKCWTNGDPTAIAVQSDEVFVSNFSKNSIQVFNLHDLTFLRSWESAGGRRLSSPSGLSVSSKSVWVSDYVNCCILECSLDGKLKKTIGKKGHNPGMFYFPCNIFIDSNEIYVADSSNDRIQVLDIRSGKHVRQYDKQLRRPRSSVLHGSDLIVCDTDNHRLVVFDRDSGVAERMSEKIPFARAPYFSDVSINDRNELFVSDSDQGRIQVFM